MLKPTHILTLTRHSFYLVAGAPSYYKDVAAPNKEGWKSLPGLDLFATYKGYIKRIKPLVLENV